MWYGLTTRIYYNLFDAARFLVLAGLSILCLIFLGRVLRYLAARRVKMAVAGLGFWEWAASPCQGTSLKAGLVFWWGLLGVWVGASLQSVGSGHGTDWITGSVVLLGFTAALGGAIAIVGIFLAGLRRFFAKECAADG